VDRRLPLDRGEKIDTIWTMSNWSRPSFLPCLSNVLFGSLLLRVARAH